MPARPVGSSIIEYSLTWGYSNRKHGAHAGKEYGPVTSVKEPPLFWAALGGQGPGADSGSNLLGSAPALAKKGGSRRLRLHTLNFFILSS